MSVTDDFAKMQKLFGQFQEQIIQLAARVPPGDENAGQLRALGKLLEAKYKEFVSAFQAENSRLESQMAKLKAQVQANVAEAAKKAARRKELAAAAKSAAMPTEPALDPQLGEKLRAIILKELQEPEHKPAVPRKTEGEVADMRTNEFTTDTAPTPEKAETPKPTATPPRQPRKPKVGDESFEWESTDEWENKGI